MTVLASLYYKDQRPLLPFLVYHQHIIKYSYGRMQES